jgi:predicted amidophosphoribosyltransferase
MKCPKCNAELDNDAKICGNCGTPIAINKEESLEELKQKADKYYENEDYEKAFPLC